ncbi:MAG: hypothetical protein H5U24_17375 [Thioclava marina]|nr:hypothetical protein [Thioclava marina]TNE82870.1 MAG: hypothetical protein EP337_18185 [Paracoccaceae bacterium]
MAGLLLAAWVLQIALVLPDYPDGLVLKTFLRFPLELPAILLSLAALSRGWRATSAIRAFLAVALVVMVLLKIADIGSFIAFSRPFNLAVDSFVFDAGPRLAARTIGLPLTLLAGIGVIVGLGALITALWWASGQWTGLVRGVRWRAGASLGAALCVAAVTLQVSGTALKRWPWRADTTRIAGYHLTRYVETTRSLRLFHAAAQTDPYAGSTDLFTRLQGRDVLIVFIESYGRASFDNPLYAPTHLGTLKAAEPRLRQAGLTMRSGWLTSPTAGGQSWLAHSTLESGLTISDQTRYRALLASPRKTLFDLANASGLRTLAVMPGITMDWPEGPKQGFQSIFAAADLGYRGEAFNFVTMPDQFTLAAFDRLVTRGQPEAPLLAQIVLLSSHAPWVPVPRMLPWEELGDGTVFNEMARAGDPPKVVWRDRDRVREQYRQAIDYSLQAILAFAERQTQDPPLLVILGDHQPASFVAQSENRDVPVHLIGPPDLVALFDGWNWTEGLVPDAQAPVRPMRDFRDRFIEALSGTGSELGG